MKIFTAKEARTSQSKGVSPERIDAAVAVVNATVKNRVSGGASNALIGGAPKAWEAISELNEAERSELLDALRSAGYTVDESLDKPFFRLVWKSDPEDQE